MCKEASFDFVHTSRFIFLKVVNIVEMRRACDRFAPQLLVQYPQNCSLSSCFFEKTPMAYL